MLIKNTAKPSLVYHGADVYDKISDYRQVITKLCVQQVEKTPVIVITDDEKLLLQKKIQKEGIFIEALWNQTILQSNSSLSLFSKRHG